MPSPNPCDVSIILVHYRTENLLANCLERLYRGLQKSGRTHEVFVVDNGSAPEKMQPVRKSFPQAHWIANAQNKGFAKAANQGLQTAQGKYCLLLNPDCLVSQDTVGLLTAAMEENPRVGIAGGRHVFPDGRLQPSARTFPTLWNVFTDQLLLNKLFPHSPLFNAYRMGGWKHDTKREVDQLMGSCLMLRRAMLDRIGCMDERFFLYFEEVDLCRRAKEAGWKIMFFPDPRMQVLHEGGASSKQNLRDRTIHRHQSLCLWLRKYSTPPQVGLAKIFILKGLCLRLLAYALSGKKDLFRAHAAALKQWSDW